MHSEFIRSYIALGSNIQNPRQQIAIAIGALQQLPQTKFLSCSSLYQTPPLPPVIDQPDVINAVVSVDTNLSAPELLRELQKIEHQQGRQRIQHWGPRTLDLDLLLYGNEFIDTDELTIPHPEMRKRNFVLYPLAEIAMDLVLPTGEKLQTLLNLLPIPQQIA